MGSDQGQDLVSVPLRHGRFHEHEGGGAVVDARRVARGDRALVVVGEHRAELRQRLERRLGPGVFVRVDDHGIALALRHFDGNEFVGEEPHLVGQSPALLAEHGEAVLLLATDVELACDVLRRLPHGVGMMQGGKLRIREPPADGGVVNLGLAVEGGVRLRHGERSTAHAFRAAGDVDVAATGFDHAGGDVDGFESGCAESVDRAAGHRVGQSGQKRGHAGHIAIVLPGLVRGSEVDVRNQVRIDPGSADGLGDHEGGEIIRADGGEGSSVAAERGSDRLYDGCTALWHGSG